jgi:hypothetical protein
VSRRDRRAEDVSFFPSSGFQVDDSERSVDAGKERERVVPHVVNVIVDDKRFD